MNEKEYTIQDLCNRTDISRRTIHFYTQQNLLPPPKGAGVGSRYTETHLLRLKLIPKLRRDGLRLNEIRSKFTTMDQEEMQNLLTQFGEHEEEQKGVPIQRKTFHHYFLPYDITLIIPSPLNDKARERISKLTEAINVIFNK